MPPAACLPIRGFLPVLAGLQLALAGPTVLVDDGFDAASDSLWHFQASAFTEGVLSPGLEADLRGHGDASGLLGIDADASALVFLPRRGVKPHRSCFFGWRGDFRMEGVHASRVEVEIDGEVRNPAAADPVGGLYLLVRYQDEHGNPQLARTAWDIRHPQTVRLDTSALVPIRRTDWFGAPLDEDRRTYAVAHVIGLGLCHISAVTGAAQAKPLQVGGFRARGELRWPRLPGIPEEAEIMAGDTVALAWKFPPALEAEFRWYRNEKPVAGESGRRYVFRPGPDDARIHVFRADATLPNGDRLATESIRVRVTRPMPPALGRQSGDTAVPEGGTAVLRVQATGLQPLTYQWFRNGKPIPGARGANHAFSPGSAAEGGSFHCEVADRRGLQARSRPAMVLVKAGLEQEAGLPRGLAAGPKLGLNVSNFHQDPGAPARAVAKLNFLQAGAGLAWQFRPSWALQAEMLFARKGVLYDHGEYTSTFVLDYLEWPLLLKAKPGKWLRKSPVALLAGGYGAWLVNAKREEEWGAWKGSEPLDSFAAYDYGATLGLSWQFGVLSAEMRYSLGLAGLEEGAAEPRKNSALSAMVGFALFTAQEGPR